MKMTIDKTFLDTKDHTKSKGIALYFTLISVYNFFHLSCRIRRCLLKHITVQYIFLDNLRNILGEKVNNGK